MVLQEIKNLIDKHEIISFDIFDTLLLRIYAKPTDLFLHIEKLYSIPGFSKARIAAESNARMHNTKEEITLDDIYKELPDYFRSYKSKEIELEIASLKVNNEIYCAYKYALEKKKKVIITSDMYLPKDVLINVLAKNGYHEYDQFYLSNDISFTKHSGALYEYILKQLNISNPQLLLHIGDNFHVDYEKAIEKKLHAYHYKSALEQLFENNIRCKIYYKQNENSIGASIILGLLAYNNLKHQNNYWKNFGYNYAGPTIFSYAYWLKKSFEKDNIDDALFVARDGYSLKKVFALINTNNKVRTSYIYAPRVLSTLFFLDFNEKKYYDLTEKLSAIRTILSNYQDRHEILKKETPINPDINEGIEFIEKYIDIYKQLAQEDIKSYKAYIENLALGKRTAIIDTCSINLSSQRLIEQVINKQLYGYYFLLQANENININLDDYILRAYRGDPSVWIKDWDVMEFFMTSPEPPIQNFLNGKPIYKKQNKYETIRSDVYPILSDGIVDFAQDLIASFSNYDPFISWQDIFNWINILCSVPTSYDKKMVSKINHAFDFSHEKYVPICKDWFDFTYDNNIQTKNKWFIRDIPILKKIIRGNIRTYFFLGIPIARLEKKGKNINYYVLKIILLYKRKEKKNMMKYYIFNIPIFSIDKN
ncbi:MAG: hypothetical protein J6578_09505 [Snodgrassella sp.]|uniref:HAD family hydrolase n=1 Tax=Snodgrassella sp. TaxID=2815304 RepID=UPI002582605A|nr:hypothetical protein [Snodgrassella sp.]MCO6509003.1 hypothetical protein [Snodgrassella sp.]MCO6528761.1 hypothetical protein [Lactobacillus sp.]